MRKYFNGPLNLNAKSENMPFFSIENKGGGVADIAIYGVITDEKWFEEDVTPNEFKRQLDALKGVDFINLYVNSPGGGIWAGFSIYNMLLRHPALISAHIDGMAASIASVIIMAADEINIPKNGMIMIHRPLVGMVGFAEDLRKEADLLDKLQDQIIGIYRDKKGMKSKEDEIKQMMYETTYMNGEEAVALGFADTLLTKEDVKASVSNKMLIMNGQRLDLSGLKPFPENKFSLEKEAEKAVLNGNFALKVAENHLKINSILSKE